MTVTKITVTIEDNYDEGTEIRRLSGLLLDDNYALVLMDYSYAIRIIPVKLTSEANVYEYAGGMYKHVFIFDDNLDVTILDKIADMNAIEFA